MASPQTENGWTKIADEILEALAQTQMSGHEWRLVMGLLRQTYGFKKKADSISFSQWEKLTGLGRQRVGEAIKRLEARKIIMVDRNNHTNTYSFQKDYSKWDGTQIRTSTGKRTSTEKRNETSTRKRTKTSTENRTHNIHERHDIHDEKESSGPKTTTENQAMFGIICEVCGIDWHVASESKKGQINQSGKKLRDGGYTPSDVQSFGVWWLENDWRGQKGQAPTPVQIRDEIGKWKNGNAGKVNLR